MKKLILTAISVLLLCALLTGCVSYFSNGSFSGSYSQSGTKVKANFSSMNGERGATIPLKQGDKISITYDLACEDGALTLTFETKDGTVLFTASELSGVEVITADADQRYTLRIKAEKAKGSYDVSWSVN